MSTLFTQNEESIHDALDRCTISADRIEHGRWTARVEHGLDNGIEVKLDDQWLLFSASLGKSSLPRRHAWNAVRSVARLDGGSKIVLDPVDHSVSLREEVPLTKNGGNGHDFADPCSQALTSLNAAIVALRGRVDFEVVDALDDAAPELALGECGECIREACGESGWSLTERPNGEIAVELNTGGGFYRASFETLPRNAWRASVSVARYDVISEPTRQAVAVMLLTANGLIRFARGCVEDTSKGTRALFEVRSFGPPATTAVDHALCALSAACTICGRELQALTDESVARRFLAVRGWSSR